MTTDDANVRFINPLELAATPGYTHVVEASGGRTIYVSGQIALDRSLLANQCPTTARAKLRSMPWTSLLGRVATRRRALS